jgi:hypothetical protein
MILFTPEVVQEIEETVEKNSMQRTLTERFTELGGGGVEGRGVREKRENYNFVMPSRTV